MNIATPWQSFRFLNREAKKFYEVQVQLCELFVPITDSRFYSLKYLSEVFICPLYQGLRLDMILPNPPPDRFAYNKKKATLHLVETWLFLSISFYLNDAIGFF